MKKRSCKSSASGRSRRLNSTRLPEQQRAVLWSIFERVRAGLAEQNLITENGLFGELAAALAYGIGRLRDAVSLGVSEERFRSLASASPIGILEVDESGAMLYANPRICEISGVDTPVPGIPAPPEPPAATT